MNLDDKLKEIVVGIADVGDELDDAGVMAIEEIKQAFADAGWRRIYGDPVELDPKDEISDLSEIRRLTGQEWYHRFVEEFNYLVKGKFYPTDGGKTLAEDVDKVAKRAAGLK